MRVGLIGLGRIGTGLRARWLAAGHEVVGYDRVPGLSDVGSLLALVAALPAPRVCWLMVPAEAVEVVIAELAPLLARGDCMIDGGNSRYDDSVRRGAALAQRGIAFLDAGTSGGVEGAERGYCLMVGGVAESVAAVEPLLRALAVEGGYAHVGGPGAGHYVKMVHNAIEYGLLQSYAEGFALLDRYDEPLDLPAIARLWNRGSVVRSWLLELAERALAGDPGLERLRGYVEDSGEGRWAAQEAVARGVPANVLAASLFARFASRDANSFAMRLVAALRGQFGGHRVER
ncbi:MAG: decarboxylating 6-phosphogluconate dehydrogenase [Dehalococcoidia bacterium]|nr:decarboxylating 6-phosphogluconate dehydrogenase [Dehalococcoidia bacterium]